MLRRWLYHLLIRNHQRSSTRLARLPRSIRLLIPRQRNSRQLLANLWRRMREPGPQIGFDFCPAPLFLRRHLEPFGVEGVERAQACDG